MHRTTPTAIAALLLLAILPAVRADEPTDDRPPAVSAEVRASLDRISADSLRGHLSFLASDRLEGRGTPSRGLDIAAEYIAAQFRRAGLEPVGDDGYFQTTDWKYLAPDPETFRRADGRPTDARSPVTTPTTPRARLRRRGSTSRPRRRSRSTRPTPTPSQSLIARRSRARSCCMWPPRPTRRTGRAAEASSRKRDAFAPPGDRRPQAGSFVVEVDRDADGATGLRRAAAGRGAGRMFFGSTTPRITVHSPQLASAIDAQAAGPSTATLRLRVGEPAEGADGEGPQRRRPAPRLRPRAARRPT